MQEPHKKKTIGFLTGDLSWEDTYPDLLYRANYKVADTLGCNIVFMVGRSRGDQVQNHVDRALYAMIDEQGLDGLIISPAIITIMDKQHIDAFKKSLPDLPTIILTEFPHEHPIVIVDNESGMLAMMDHLINVHKRKKIGIVLGPLSHFESRIRRDCWRQSLITAKLPHDDSQMVECDWLGYGIEKSLKELFQKSPDLDAIVFSNDIPALKALPMLKSMGKKIPQDLSLTGFDDIRSTQFSDPPLSSIRQPIELQLEQAYKLILDGKYHENIGKTFRITSQFIVRESCGCLPVNEMNSSQYQLEINERFVASQFATDRLNILTQSLTRGVRFDQVTEVLTSFLHEIGLKTFCFSLIASDNRFPARHSPELIQGGYIPSPPKLLRAIAAYPELLPSELGNYHAEKIVPAGWEKRKGDIHTIILPLASNGSWYGLLVIEARPNHGLILRSLQETLAAYLEREYRFEDLLSQAIQEKLRLSFESQKSKIMSDLVAGVAHEINTPLGSGITAISFLSREIDAMIKSFDENRIRASELRSFLVSHDESIRLIEKSLLRLSELVGAFKKVSTENFFSSIVNFRLYDLIATIIQETKHNLNTFIHIEVIGDRNLQIEADMYALQEIISRLLNNALVHGEGQKALDSVEINFGLINNKVEIDITDHGSGIEPSLLTRIWEPFFSTRRNKGHIGLGLNIVQNLINYKLYGNISLVNGECDGLKASISFPIQTK